GAGHNNSTSQEERPNTMKQSFHSHKSEGFGPDCITGHKLLVSDTKTEKEKELRGTIASGRLVSSRPNQPIQLVRVWTNSGFFAYWERSHWRYENGHQKGNCVEPIEFGVSGWIDGWRFSVGGSVGVCFV